MIPGIIAQQGVGAAGGGGDPHWANVVLLIQPAGPDASTSFVDLATGKTITTRGTGQMDTAVTIFSPATLTTTLGGYLDGIQLADSDDWHFGAGEFTVECFLRMNSAPGNMAIMGQWESGESWFLYVDGGSLKFRFYDTGLAIRDTSYAWTTRTTGVTYHIAATRDGSGNVRLFIDGVLVVTASRPQTVINANGKLQVGLLAGFDSYDSSCWFDQIRITKGVCRYTATFTVPTAAFPAF